MFLRYKSMQPLSQKTIRLTKINSRNTVVECAPEDDNSNDNGTNLIFFALKGR